MAKRKSTFKAVMMQLEIANRDADGYCKLNAQQVDGLLAEILELRKENKKLRRDAKAL